MMDGVLIALALGGLALTGWSIYELFGVWAVLGCVGAITFLIVAATVD